MVRNLLDEYIDKLTHHFIYKNDETSLANYCASITMYPWLIGGTTPSVEIPVRPPIWKSFVADLSIWFHGVEYAQRCMCHSGILMYLNYFIGLEYGKDYYKESDKVVDLSLNSAPSTR